MHSLTSTIRRALAAGFLIMLAPAAWASVPTIVHVEDGALNAPFALSFSRTKLPAGWVELVVRNDARSMDHDVVIARTNRKADNLPYDRQSLRVAERKLDVVGVIGHMTPGRVVDDALDLKPGHYVAFGNEPGDYRAGMYTSFTVTPRKGAGREAGAPASVASRDAIASRAPPRSS